MPQGLFLDGCPQMVFNCRRAQEIPINQRAGARDII
jgi:hypothetical protein